MRQRVRTFHKKATDGNCSVEGRTRPATERYKDFVRSLHKSHDMSRNPFLDLGFSLEDATALHIHAQLAAALEHHIQRKGWSQREAARALKVPQLTVIKIFNGNIDKLSIEFLIKLMVRADLFVRLSGDRAISARRRADRGVTIV